MFLNLFDDGEPEAGWDTRQARGGGGRYSLFGVELDFHDSTTVNGEMGTGTVVWDSGEALAEFLSVGDGYGSAGLTGKRVLEVGAGVSGLPGIAALLGGAVHVTLTDQAQLLPLLERNVAGAVVSALAHQQQLVTAAAAAVLANSAAAEAAAAVIVAETECLSRRYAVEALDWAKADCFMSINSRPPFDLVLLADCTFSAESDEVLMAMLPLLCGPSTEVLLLHNFRCPIVHKRLLKLFEQRFIWSEIPRSELGEKWESVNYEYLHMYKLRILPVAAISTSGEAVVDAGEAEKSIQPPSNSNQCKTAKDISKLERP